MFLLTEMNLLDYFEERSPMTTCEEFLYGMTTVGVGRRDLVAFGLYAQSFFLA